MCWCRRGRNHYHQTPGNSETGTGNVNANFPRMGFLPLHVCICCAALLYLYSAVSPVSYDDVPINVHSYTSGSVELAVSFTVRAEFQYQLSIWSENLRGGERISESILMSPPQLPLNKLLNVDLFTPVILDSVYSFISVTFSQYLDRVVMEVSHNDLIVLVHCCKVWTFRTRT